MPLKIESVFVDSGKQYITDKLCLVLERNHKSRYLSSVWCCPETTLHILHDCAIAKDLWKSIGQSVIKTSFFQFNLLSWLEENLFDDTRTTNGIEWPLLFSTTYNTL